MLIKILFFFLDIVWGLYDINVFGMVDYLIVLKKLNYLVSKGLVFRRGFFSRGLGRWKRFLCCWRRGSFVRFIFVDSLMRIRGYSGDRRVVVWFFFVMLKMYGYFFKYVLIKEGIFVLSFFLWKLLSFFSVFIF